MSKYFVDISDGDHFARDEEGQVFAAAANAREEAVTALAEILRCGELDGHPRLVVATVRDEGGETVFKATLSLHCEPLN